MANELENTNENTTTTNDADLKARVEALEKENDKLRKANTNASAEASKYKHEKDDLQKQLDARLSDEEKAKAAQDAENAAIRQQLEQMTRERNVAHYVSTLVANDIGMDAEIAKTVAEALDAGEVEKVFDGIRKFITAHDKSLRESALMNNQTLQSGATEKAMTQEEFNDLPYMEMLRFKTEHPEQYKKFTEN